MFNNFYRQKRKVTPLAPGATTQTQYLVGKYYTLWHELTFWAFALGYGVSPTSAVFHGV